MLAAKTTLHPLPDLRALCVLCVKSHLQPRSDQSRHLAAKPSRIRTSAKHTRNPFRIRTSKTQDLKPFRMSTYRKRGRGATLCEQLLRGPTTHYSLLTTHYPLPVERNAAPSSNGCKDCKTCGNSDASVVT